MRCALLFSGEPRFFAESWERNALTVRDLHPWDVFFHAWFNPESAGSCWRSNYNGEEGGRVHADTAERLVELYQPKAWKIEPNRQFPKHDYRWEGSPDHPEVNAIQSHFYSNRQLSLLKCQYELEQGFRYDLCLRLRFDNVVDTPVPLEGLDLSSALWMAHYLTETQIGDQIYLGHSTVMDRFWEAYHHIPELHQHSLPYLGGLSAHGMLRSWTKLAPLPVNVLPHFTFGILRGRDHVEKTWNQSA